MASMRSSSVKPLAKEESLHEHVAERRQLCARQDRCGGKAAVDRSDIQGNHRNVESLDRGYDVGSIAKAKEEAVTPQRP